MKPILIIGTCLALVTFSHAELAPVITEDFALNSAEKPLAGMETATGGKKWEEMSSVITDKIDSFSIRSANGLAWSGWGYPGFVFVNVSDVAGSKIAVDVKYRTSLSQGNQWFGVGFTTGKDAYLDGAGSFAVLIGPDSTGSYGWSLISNSQLSPRHEEGNIQTGEISAYRLVLDKKTGLCSLFINGDEVLTDYQLTDSEGGLWEPKELLNAGFMFTGIGGRENAVSDFSVLSEK